MEKKSGISPKIICKYKLTASCMEYIYILVVYLIFVMKIVETSDRNIENKKK